MMMNFFFQYSRWDKCWGNFWDSMAWPCHHACFVVGRVGFGLETSGRASWGEGLPARKKGYHTILSRRDFNATRREYHCVSCKKTRLLSCQT